jgi:alpha-amylase/alpha-mannosidase (GH57 family)
MVSPMWCQTVKLSPAPNDMFAKSELKLFQSDRLTRSNGIQKLLRRREFLERLQKLISPCITYVCKKKVGPHNFLKKMIV